MKRRFPRLVASGSTFVHGLCISFLSFLRITITQECPDILLSKTPQLGISIAIAAVVGERSSYVGKHIIISVVRSIVVHSIITLLGLIEGTSSAMTMRLNMIPLDYIAVAELVVTLGT